MHALLLFTVQGQEKFQNFTQFGDDKSCELCYIFPTAASGLRLRREAYNNIVFRSCSWEQRPFLCRLDLVTQILIKHKQNVVSNFQGKASLETTLHQNFHNKYIAVNKFTI